MERPDTRIRDDSRPVRYGNYAKGAASSHLNARASDALPSTYQCAMLNGRRLRH